MPEQTKLAASGSTPPPRQITSLRRLPEVADASKSIFGVRKNPSRHRQFWHPAQAPRGGPSLVAGIGYLECRNHARSTRRPTGRVTTSDLENWKALSTGNGDSVAGDAQ